MSVSIRLERSVKGGSLPVYDVVVRGKRGTRGGYLECIGNYRLFGAYKIFHIKRERLGYWLSVGAICSKRVLKELTKDGVIKE